MNKLMSKFTALLPCTQDQIALFFLLLLFCFVSFCFNKVQKCNLSPAFIFIRQSNSMARGKKKKNRGKKVSELHQDLKGNR